MQVGTPSEVFDKPANLFVAEFIGAPKMNTFPAKLIRTADKYHVECFGCKLPVEGEKAQELKEAGIGTMDITLGVRPEHMIFSEKAIPGYIPCEIAVNEMMGSEVHLHVNTLDNPEKPTSLIVRIPTVGLSTAQRQGLVAGAKIYVGFEGKVMHFFHPLTLADKIIQHVAERKEKGSSVQGLAKIDDMGEEKAQAYVDEMIANGLIKDYKGRLVATPEGKIEGEKIKDTNLLYGPGEEAAASQANV